MPQFGARFARILQPGLQPRLEDTRLFEIDDIVAVPTLGSILPKWLLLIPLAHSFNMAQQVGLGKQIGRAIALASATLSEPGDDVLVFEHGAVSKGSMLACGVEHAHLHVLVAPSGFLQSVWDAATISLIGTRTPYADDDLYGRVSSDRPYYAMWWHGQMLLEQPVVTEESQRFRRIIATCAGRADTWDYKRDPCYPNMQIAIERFRRSELVTA